jgi:hypothetical protein
MPPRRPERSGALTRDWFGQRGRLAVVFLVASGFITAAATIVIAQNENPAPASSEAAPPASPEAATKPAGEAANASATEAAATPAAPAPAQIPWELRPYVVELPVSFTSDPKLTPVVREAFLRSLRQRLIDDLGPMWDLHLSEATGEALTSPEHLGIVSGDEVKTRWATPQTDKVLLLVVGRNGRDREFSVREWDASSENLGPVVTGTSADARLDVISAASVVRNAFRSLVIIELVEGLTTNLRVRAGELLPPDPSAAQLVVGDLLAPYYRQLGRKRELKQIHFVPWTLLKVEAIDRARLTAKMFSVSRVASATRRLESLAIEVRPWYPETRLKVVPRTNPGNPVAGARVDIVDRMPTGADPVPDRLTLRTDRDGSFTVAAEPTPQIRYAIVNSGQAILARVPFCPGAQREMIINVIDDTPRLSVEGELALLEADLIELVARRQILLVRANGFAKQGKLDEAKDLIAQLKALPNTESLQQRIALVRTAGVESARTRKDTVAESRIVKLCTTLLTTAKTHLDEEKFTETLRSLEELAQAGADAAKKK